MSDATPWWESQREGEPVCLGFVKIDRVGSTQDWKDRTPHDAVLIRSRYQAGVETLARAFDVAQPLSWQGDGVMLFVRGASLVEASRQALKLARLVRERCVSDLNLPVRLAVHAARVSWAADTGKLAHPALDICGHLEHASPVNAIAVTEDVYLAMEAPTEFGLLGVTKRDGTVAYASPAPTAAPLSDALLPFEDATLWQRLCRYARHDPNVARLRYVGFRLHRRREPPSLDLRDVFISPLVRSRSQRPALPLKELLVEGPVPEAAGALRAFESPPEEFAQLWHRHRTLVVLGDPGSGKTTLLRWLAGMAARGALTLVDELGVDERLLPVLVSVGRLAELRRERPASSVLDALVLYLHERSIDDPNIREGLARALAEHRCLLLLDGLDEVRAEERGAVRDWLESFAAQHLGNRIVATSRLVGYPGFLPTTATELTIEPFSDEQVGRYVRAFTRAYRAWEDRDADPARADESADELLRQLTENARLHDLARNPFMLSALALIHRAQGSLPRHRVEAYEVFAKALCEEWGRIRRLVVGDQGPRIDYAGEAVPILGGLALQMHELFPTGVAPRTWMVDTIAGLLLARGGLEDKEARASAERFLSRAGEEVQILLERGPDQWGFIHLTFQEFFAAVGLHEQEAFDDALAERLFDPRWEEVLRLGVGYIALIQGRGKKAEQVVLRVLEWKESGDRAWLTEILEKQVPLATLLASEAGEVLTPATQKKVVERFAQWLFKMPEKAWGGVLKELSLSSFREVIGEAIVPYTKREDEDERRRAMAFQAALKARVLSDSAKALLGDPSGAVRRTAARAIASLGLRDAADVLEHGLTRDEDLVEKWACIGLCAQERAEVRLRGWLEEPQFTRTKEVIDAFDFLGSASDWPDDIVDGWLRRGITEEATRPTAMMVAAANGREWLLDLDGQQSRDNPEEYLVILATTSSRARQVLEGRIDESVTTAGLALVASAALSPHARERATARLIDGLEGEWRGPAALALVGCGDIRGLRILKELLSDAAPPVRTGSIPFLRDSGLPGSADLLVSMLDDADPDVRVAASLALGKMSGPAAISPLLRCYERFPDTRSSVIAALWQLASRPT